MFVRLAILNDTYRNYQRSGCVRNLDVSPIAELQMHYLVNLVLQQVPPQVFYSLIGLSYQSILGY